MKTPIRVCPGVHKIEEGTYLISGIITNPKDHNLERTLWGGKDYSQEYNDAGEEIKELEQELAYSPDSAYEAREDEEDEEEDEEEDDDDDESEESCPENLVYSVDTADPEEKLEELYAEGYGRDSTQYQYSRVVSLILYKEICINFFSTYY